MQSTQALIDELFQEEVNESRQIVVGAREMKFQKTTLRRKQFVVDGRKYVVSITAVGEHSDEPVTLRITIRADFGHRSFCTIRGLRNYERWWNYGYWMKADYSESTARANQISVTPHLIAELIRLAHERGWNPDDCKTNHELQIENSEAKTLITCNQLKY
jgi:hypothetical protein